jgi:hypothetical protein
VNAQEQGIGTVLNSGDVIETQAGASVVLELSDGSQLELGENTKVDIAVLSQTAIGARVSRVKLLWGRIRAFLSPQHQIEGSSFDIETPNALIGVKFSEPDIEVSYNLEKAETVGIAHTVELMAKNLVTNEEVLVPVGSSVIITAVGIKVVAGILGAVGSSGVGSTGTGSVSTGSTGMSTGTKVAIGAGAAAAGGVAVAAASSGDGDGDVSMIWEFSGSCVAQGCTNNMICKPGICGPEICDTCKYDATVHVTQSGNVLSGYIKDFPYPFTLYGIVNDKVVTFNTETGGPPLAFGPLYNRYEGVIDGNTIRGTNSGYAPYGTTDGRTGNITWEGTFTVTIKKE